MCKKYGMIQRCDLKSFTNLTTYSPSPFLCLARQHIIAGSTIKDISSPVMGIATFQFMVTRRMLDFICLSVSSPTKNVLQLIFSGKTISKQCFILIYGALRLISLSLSLSLYLYIFLSIFHVLSFILSLMTILSLSISPCHIYWNHIHIFTYL